MASRRKGRILAFQALFAWESNGEAGSITELLDFPWLEPERRARLDEGALDFSRLLVVGTVENIGSIDKMIRSHLKNWEISRLNRVDLAILRMSCYALMYQETAPSIVINEAIGISREYGTDDSYRFINGVLDSIRKDLERDASENVPEKGGAE